MEIGSSGSIGGANLNPLGTSVDGAGTAAKAALKSGLFSLHAEQSLQVAVDEMRALQQQGPSVSAGMGGGPRLFSEESAARRIVSERSVSMPAGADESQTSALQSNAAMEEGQKPEVAQLRMLIRPPGHPGLLSESAAIGNTSKSTGAAGQRLEPTVIDNQLRDFWKSMIDTMEEREGLEAVEHDHARDSGFLNMRGAEIKREVMQMPEGEGRDRAMAKLEKFLTSEMSRVESRYQRGLASFGAGNESQGYSLQSAFSEPVPQPKIPIREVGGQAMTADLQSSAVQLQSKLQNLQSQTDLVAKRVLVPLQS